MLDTFGSQSTGVVVSSADLQLKLTDNKSSLAAAAAGMGMENGAGKKLIEITGPALSKRKLLVGLDLLCLFLGKYTCCKQKHFTCVFICISLLNPTLLLLFIFLMKTPVALFGLNDIIRGV